MKLDKVRIAGAFAEALDSYLSDGGAYQELIDSLKVGPKAKEWLTDSVRWTLIDDTTGQNLLECEEDKAKREGYDYLINAARLVVRHWESGDLAGSVNSLAIALRNLGVKP